MRQRLGCNKWAFSLCLWFFECQHWTQAEHCITPLSRQDLRRSCRTSSCLFSAADVSAIRCRYDGDACAQCADGYQLVNGICQRTLDSFMAQALAQSSQSSTDGKVSRAVSCRGSCCVHAEPAVRTAAPEHSLMLVVKDVVTVAAAACCPHSVEPVS